MEKDIGKRCPVCGAKVIGRTDKKFCCDDCRTYSNNTKKRERLRLYKQNKHVQQIEKSLVLMSGTDGGRYLKIIAAVTLLCKIIYKFGHQNKQI